MADAIQLPTTPSYIQGMFHPGIGANVKVVSSDTNWLGLRVRLEVSDDGENFLKVCDITEPCAFVCPWAEFARFVCLAGPQGALAAPVALVQVHD